MKRLQKVLSTALCILLVLSLLPTAAYAANTVELGFCGADGAFVRWELTDDGVLTLDGAGAIADYSNTNLPPWYSHASEITSVVIKRGVTEIGNAAFARLSGVTAATLPTGLTRIGDNAFQSCAQLQSIRIYDGVESIGANAFTSCSRLESVSLPSSLRSIGANAFRFCSALQSAPLGDSITSLGESVFYGCSKLVSIHIPSKLDSIPASAFQNCSGLTVVSIPEGVQRLGASAFRGCTKLEGLALPLSLVAAGDNAFYNCKNIRSVTYPGTQGQYLGIEGSMPEASLVSFGTQRYDNLSGSCSDTVSWSLKSGVLRISGSGDMPDYSRFLLPPWYAYAGSIRSIRIEDGVTAVGEYAFAYCDKALSAVLAPSVRSIRPYAFANCTKLSSLTFTLSMTDLGYCAFTGCTGLKNVYYSGDEFCWEELCRRIPNGNDALLSASLYLDYIPDGLVIGSCGEHVTWQLDANGILTVAGSGAIRNYTQTELPPWTSYITSVRELRIAEGVTAVGQIAFYGCSKLTEISLPTTLTEIGAGAFSDCASLMAFVLPVSVTRIGEQAFDGCTGLANVYYTGSAEDWTKLQIADGNDALRNAVRFVPSAHEHIWDEGTVTVKPTCTQEGTMTFTCTGCTETKTEPITALGHSYRDTWSSDELTHWHDCPNENCTDPRGSEDAHHFGAYTYNNDARPGVDGTESASCTVCGYVSTRTKAGTALDASVEVTIVSRTVKLGEQVIDGTKDQYPFVMYNEITYLPLTYSGCGALGLQSSWTAEDGLSVVATGEVRTYSATPNTVPNTGKQTAQIAAGKISLNGISIDNTKEQYPFLLFRDVTYLPMTWTNMNTYLGCASNYTEAEGLVVTPAENPNVVSVTLCTYPVTLGDQLIDSSNDMYPFFNYNGITYLPLTYFGCGALGLYSEWSAENGIVITKTGTPISYEGTTSSGNTASFKANKTTMKVTLSGVVLTGENYPILSYRDVTYIPMTWTNMHDILGCEQSFDSTTGLSIGVAQ